MRYRWGIIMLYGNAPLEDMLEVTSISQNHLVACRMLHTGLKMQHSTGVCQKYVRQCRSTTMVGVHLIKQSDLAYHDCRRYIWTNMPHSCESADRSERYVEQCSIHTLSDNWYHSAAYQTVLVLRLLAVPHAAEVTMLPSHNEVRYCRV